MQNSERRIPGRLAGLASLHGRVPKNHSSFLTIENDYKSWKAGFAGELKVDQFMGELELKKPFYVLNDLYLQIGNRNVQFDKIIIHPNFFCVFEIKNMRGEFYFDHNNEQFFRVNSAGEREGMRNPELQLLRAINSMTS